MRHPVFNRLCPHLPSEDPHHLKTCRDVLRDEMMTNIGFDAPLEERIACLEAFTLLESQHQENVLMGRWHP